MPSEHENAGQSIPDGQPVDEAVDANEETQEGVLNEVESEETGEEVKDASEESTEEASGNFIESLPEEAQKAFKTMQSNLNKSNEGLKGFEQFGGAEKALQWLTLASTDKGFIEYLQSRQNPTSVSKETSEVEDDGLDDETRRAMDIVRQVAQEEAKKQFAPLNEIQSQAHIQEVMSQMDSEQPGWRDLQKDMSQLASLLPENAQNKPSLEDMRALYFMALSKSGGINDYATKLEQKRLEDLKRKSTPKPSTPSRVSSNKIAKSFREAAEMAKQQLGA